MVGVAMKSVNRLIVCLFIIFGCAAEVIQPVLAQETPSDPIINVVAKDEPLIDILDEIAQDTGYRFTLTPQWEDHAVSANIKNLTLEQGLKRLLRSLNYTILWEADKTVTIMVYGKANPDRSGGVSFAAPPHPTPSEDAPPIESAEQPLDEHEDTVDSGADNPSDASVEPTLKSSDAPGEQDGNAGERPNDSSIE